MQNNIFKNDFKSGFVCLLGRPNAGKSSFLNKVIGTKISITSKTAQTTRNTIKGIYSNDKAQIVFIDTPGIHKPQNGLGEYMNKASIDSLKDCDLILWIVDASESFGKGDEYVLNLLNGIKTDVILVFNKMDLVNKDDSKFKDNVNNFINGYNFASVNYISSIKDEDNGISELIDSIISKLEYGPKYYDDDVLSDSLERFFCEEIIREKIFANCKEEVPHSSAVEIMEMKEEEDLVYIYANIIVERDSQKKILIGKDGQMIKKIKQKAKRDIKILLGIQVDLELFVKVDKAWRDNKSSLRRLGYK